MLKSDLIKALDTYPNDYKIFILDDEFYLCEPEIILRDSYVKMGMADKPYLLLEADLNLLIKES